LRASMQRTRHLLLLLVGWSVCDAFFMTGPRAIGHTHRPVDHGRSSPTMNIFNQIFEDFKVAQAVQREDQRTVEAMPAAINQRSYVSASHILLPTVNAAEELKERIEAGDMSFEEAASQYSACRTKSKGGSLGSFKSLARILFLPYESQFSAVEPFDEIVFDRSVAVGTISLVGTPFGTHLVKVTERDVKLR